jgi:hypothetical protein
MQYYVRYFSFWQNAPDKYAGPFKSRAEAEATALEKIPGCVFPGQSPADIKTAHRIIILPAHKMPAGSFRKFIAEYLLNHFNLNDGEFYARYPVTLNVTEVESHRLQSLIEKARF